MNHYHERQLVDLVKRHDEAEHAGERREAATIAKRIFLRYGYRVQDAGAGQPRLVQ